MLPSIAPKSLRDARRGFLWWSLGLIGFVALIVSVYPTVHSNPSLNKLAQDYPQALKAFIAFGGQVDYTTPAGYLGIELFSLMVPLLLMIAAIGTGAGAIAGEEERGTLELLLANPVSRARVVLEKSAALALEIAALGLVLWLALWIGAIAAGMDISAGRLAGPCLRSSRAAARCCDRQARARDRRQRGGRSCGLPRQRAGSARARARDSAEVFAVLPLRGRRSTASRALARSHVRARCDRRRSDADRTCGLLAP